MQVDVKSSSAFAIACGIKHLNSRLFAVGDRQRVNGPIVGTYSKCARMCAGASKQAMPEQRRFRRSSSEVGRRHQSVWRHPHWSYNSSIFLLLVFVLMAPNNNNQKNGEPSGGGMLVQGAETLLTADQIAVDWRFSLENSVLEQGNAIVVWEDWVYATTTSGTLYRLPRQLPNGDNIFNYDENADNNGVVQFTPSSKGSISCQSGAIVVEGTIIYVVLEEDSDSKSSRILGVDASTMELRWSLLLENDAVIMGTPVLGGNDNSKYLYASHYSSTQGGQLTVIKMDDPTTEASVAATLDLAMDRVTPAAIARNGDVVYVAATTNDSGRLWSISWSDQHETLDGVGSSAYVVTTVSDLGGLAVAPPAVTLAGGVYLGQEESLVLGWTNSQNGAVPDWGYSLLAGTVDVDARELFLHSSVIRKLRAIGSSPQFLTYSFWFLDAVRILFSHSNCTHSV